MDWRIGGGLASRLELQKGIPYMRHDHEVVPRQIDGFIGGFEDGRGGEI